MSLQLFLQFLSDSLYTWQKFSLGVEDVQDANFVKILLRVNELLPLIQLKKSCFNLFLLTRSLFHYDKNKTIPIFVNISLLYCGKMKVFRGKLESACLSIHVSVCQSVQNTSVCQSAGRGIKSHLVTALVYPIWHLFLAPLAVGKRAYVMARCPSCFRPSVRLFMRPSVCKLFL